MRYICSTILGAFLCPFLYRNRNFWLVGFFITCEKMRKTSNNHSGRPFSDRRWLLPFMATSLVSLTLLLAAAFGLLSPPYSNNSLSLKFVSFSRTDDPVGYFVESDLKNQKPPIRVSEPPRIAYLIAGTKGDGPRIRRVLQALYHPRNRYILHMDLEVPPRERIDLAIYVKEDPVFREVKNVIVMAQANLVTYKGPTMIACTLQAIAILLKEGGNWDWFVNLSASDYPLVTQDDLLHAMSHMSRGLNFIEHTRIVGWKENQRAKPIIVDPGLYLSKKAEIYWASQRRSLPTSFALFTGSAWVMLARPFLEYCIWGWENLPRTILMYYANFVSSPEGYFHTVICNSKDFKNTTLNHDLHYIAWDNPPRQHPLSLSMKDFEEMVQSGAPFARKFAKDDPVLDKIDSELLGRAHTGFTPGAWCAGGSRVGSNEDPCLVRGDDSVFRPGPGSERLKGLFEKLCSKEFQDKQCPL
ncbi:beta-glucuronosyltransferase GlcAT14B [Amborella trichopoda]|nr:beta-glucuronosyltransferase GlcAT14B [Amborella trichopoda]|eukprot:XP_006841769.2 beta-glucuronosyltransferase GlcAT14B [Amborella trichopoda]